MQIIDRELHESIVWVHEICSRSAQGKFVHKIEGKNALERGKRILIALKEIEKQDIRRKAFKSKDEFNSFKKVQIFKVSQKHARRRKSHSRTRRNIEKNNYE